MNEQIKLSIIIPQYKETEQIIFPLLSSIDNQAGIDFNQLEVLILNDCSDTILRDEFLNVFFNIKPEYIKLKKNVGLGMCRKEGLSRAKGEYIMFCDADDMFYTAGALGLFYAEIDTKHPDVCSSSWLEEQKTNGQYIYIQHHIEATWVHGKIFRKQYLLDNDINFHPKFRVHEDTFFVGQAFDLTQNKNYISQITYLWKYNPDSFTRRENGSFSYKAFPVFIDSVSELIKVLEKKKPEIMPYRITQFLIYVYFSLQLPHWESEDSFEYKEKCEEIFRSFFLEHIEFYQQYPKEKFGELYMYEKNKVLGQLNTGEKEPFESFVNRMSKN